MIIGFSKADYFPQNVIKLRVKLLNCLTYVEIHINHIHSSNWSLENCKQSWEYSLKSNIRSNCLLHQLSKALPKIIYIWKSE